MKIACIRTYRAQIPFAFSVDHHLKNRACTDSVIVAVHTEDGITGYGEGAPRTYVTGESAEEVISAFEAKLAQYPLTEISSLEDLENWESQIDNRAAMPSMMSALEIAILDALGKEQGCSISDFLSLGKNRELQYSAVLPYLSQDKLEKWLKRIAHLELPHVKLKVGHEQDKEHLKLARSILGKEVDIRVDANRAWSYKEACERISELAPFGISCVEEPLREADLRLLPQLSKSSQTPLLLDESICSLEDAQFFADSMASDKVLFNLKISKVGGLRNSATIHQFAQSQGIACQLGCHVGETAILSAAGRLFAQSHELKYLEGSYASFFMADDLSAEPMGFGKKGKARELHKAGLGIHIHPEKLKKYCLAPSSAV